MQRHEIMQRIFGGLSEVQRKRVLSIVMRASSYVQQ